MNRKGFIKNTLSVSVMSALAIDFGLISLLSESGKRTVEAKNRALVLVQLEGGNDGLNTVIPIDQYANLSKARKNLLIPDNKILGLNGSSVTGFHPAMKELQEMYNDKYLSIVQGVGFAHPDLSHFKAIDVWHTGYDQPDTISTGWLGRYLDQLDHTTSAGPAAIQIGSTMSKVLQGVRSGHSMVVRDLNCFYDLVSVQDEKMTGPTGDQIAFFRQSAEVSKSYLHKLKEATNSQTNLSRLYPPAGQNALADQLRIVAQLIGGGLQTKVYIVNVKGFDTHDGQVDFSDTTKGAHAELLSKASVAIGAFQDDLQRMGRFEDVLGMVYSEFGRRIRSNAGYGSDHGTSGPVLLFGGKLKPGITGHNPVISDIVDVDDNLPTQIDFRSLYATVLHKWLGASIPATGSILMGGYDILSNI